MSRRHAAQAEFIFRESELRHRPQDCCAIGTGAIEAAWHAPAGVVATELLELRSLLDPVVYFEVELAVRGAAAGLRRGDQELLALWREDGTLMVCRAS